MAKTEMVDGFVYDDDIEVDPLGDADILEKNMARKNHAKVGSARPSSLMYTYGPGSVMDMPHFTVMPMGLDEWDRIYARRDGRLPIIHAPRLLESVRVMLGHQVEYLRPFPWQPTEGTRFDEGKDLGVPARVFPQWMRCTGCDKLAPISEFKYININPFRPDQAEFVHENCPGHRGKSGKKRISACVPARYLISCADGHLDEFPYDWFVHRGHKCPNADHPDLRMRENAMGRGSGTTIECKSCSAKRNMSEAQGTQGRDKLPRCRGRLPHLDGFEGHGKGCDAEPRLMLIGASNLWFPVLQSIVDMPLADGSDAIVRALGDLRSALGPMAAKSLEVAANGDPSTVQMLLGMAEDVPKKIRELSADEIIELAKFNNRPQESEEERKRRKENWSPNDLLVPEWNYLQKDPAGERTVDESSGLTLSPREVSPVLEELGVTRVLAVDRLRKVNALIGFTRIDDFERTEGMDRVVKLVRDGRPEWVPATEDRGEGVFIQLDEARVAQWEARVLASKVWKQYRGAYLRNYQKRLSETAARPADPFTRMPEPRYWLIHTLAHALIRRMAVSSGYGIPSLSERLYAWSANDEKGYGPAVGLLIMTTASDSDGTLGGLVSLSQTNKLERVFLDALRDMKRCSSDPVCGNRVPEDPEDFLHGASCHCCTMISETSCERSNRFLDRRMLVNLPGDYRGEKYTDLAFFGDVDAI